MKLNQIEILLLKNIQLRKSLTKQIAANAQMEMILLSRGESNIISQFRKKNELTLEGELSIDLDTGSVTIKQVSLGTATDNTRQLNNKEV